MTDEFPEPNFPPGPSLEPPAEPRLRRSRTDRVFAGVCGGMGHYFRIDPIILRIVMVALIFAGVGLIAYLIAWIAIPEAAEGEPEAPIPARNQRATAVVLGTSLLAVGGLLLMRDHAVVSRPHVLAIGGHRRRGCHRGDIAALTRGRDECHSSLTERDLFLCGTTSRRSDHDRRMCERV